MQARASRAIAQRTTLDPDPSTKRQPHGKLDVTKLTGARRVTPDPSTEGLIEEVRVNVAHIARGCRSVRDHNPAVHEQAIDAALDALAARLSQAEEVAEAARVFVEAVKVWQARDPKLIRLGGHVLTATTYDKLVAALAASSAGDASPVGTTHSSLCAVNATGHAGPCTCGAASSAGEQTGEHD